MPTTHHRGNVPVKVWDGNGTVPIDENAIVQVSQVAMLPIVGPHVALMSDAHVGKGATVGSVVPTRKAIIPSVTGVDIGCGMCAVRTDLTSHYVSDNGKELEDLIANAIPHGGARGKELGNWDDSSVPQNVKDAWDLMYPGYRVLIEKHGQVSSRNAATQLGTLGGGNHYISINIDENDQVWLMLHSGSRGAGNRIGEHYIQMARKDMERLNRRLPNSELGYLEEGTEHFNDYMEAVGWAQEYARINRELMMENVVRALKKRTKFKLTDEAVSIHHNYVSKEVHYGEELYITRKGAVSAKLGELGIVPGCMGGRSYITRGKGNPESFCSSSHGAGRVMSRSQAKANITLEMHREDTKGVFCAKDKSVIDESKRAYKNIDDVIKAQSDLCDVVHTLQEIVNIKG